MPERLVDVKTGERLLHTFPVTTGDRTAEAGEGFKKAPLQAAANAKVVPNEELETSSARMHLSRGGPFAISSLRYFCRRVRPCWLPEMSSATRSGATTMRTARTMRSAGSTGISQVKASR
jgi:hypothetical protein